jgi:hypothetical protein
MTGGYMKKLKDRIKLRDRDKYLLMIIAGILVLIVVFFGVFRNFHKKRAELKAQNAVLGQQNQLLLQLKNKSDKYKDDTTELKENSDDLTGRYPVYLQEEDFIEYIDEVEQMVKDTYFTYLSTPEASALEVEVPVREDLLAGTEDITGAIAANRFKNTGAYLDVTRLTLNRSQATVSFLTSYAGLKEIITDIVESDRPKDIANISVAYDEGFGLLNVSMTLEFYYMKGLDKNYEGPQTDVNSSGVENIFGTTETLERLQGGSSSSKSSADDSEEDEDTEDTEEAEEDEDEDAEDAEDISDEDDSEEDPVDEDEEDETSEDKTIIIDADAEGSTKSGSSSSGESRSDSESDSKASSRSGSGSAAESGSTADTGGHG